MTLIIPSNKKLVSLNDMVGPLGNDKKDENCILDIEINKLVPFRNHPFRLYEGARLDDMVRSIKELGVLAPLLVRKQQDDKYEILSGHNRWNAAKLVGLEKVPIVVLEVSDEDAMLIVTETNLIQRSFSDLLPSEKACVLASHHTALKCQGKRNDLINQVKMLLNADEMGDKLTNDPVDQRHNSREIVGENYDLSPGTVARYLRINVLPDNLKQYVDDNSISVRAGVEISYLSEVNQSYLAGFLDSGKKLDMEKAAKLHELQKNEKLNEVNMERVLDGTYKSKTKKPQSILKGYKIQPKTMKKYFKEEQTMEEVSAIIDNALELYFKSHQGGL